MHTDNKYNSYQINPVKKSVLICEICGNENELVSLSKKMKAYFLYIFLFLILSLNTKAQSHAVIDSVPDIKVETMPEFPGGIEAMKKYISENVHYPDSAKNNSLQGKCFVKFIINTDGSISNVSVLKGVPRCAECDTEAVRVVRAMPKWKPGIVNKKPALIYYNLPIIFKMQ